MLMCPGWAQVQATATAQAAWTPLWAAPEVFRQERISISADIWSYGLIIWVRALALHGT